MHKASVRREVGEDVHDTIQIQKIEAHATRATDLAICDEFNDLQLVILREAELRRTQQLIRIAERASI